MNDALAGLTIMVIEDEPETLELVSMVLENHGASVITAANAEAAIDLLASVKPDVVVSDLNLPGADGCEVVRRVRESHGATLPAIALSASSTLGDAKRALEAGFDVHVSKPVSSDELIEAVRAVSGSLPSC